MSHLAPVGVNGGQTTTWGASEIPGFASMDPGEKITIDVTATVTACEMLENNADARWGCDLVSDCYNTADTVPPSTATASVRAHRQNAAHSICPPQRHLYVLRGLCGCFLHHNQQRRRQGP